MDLREVGCGCVCVQSVSGSPKAERGTDGGRTKLYVRLEWIYITQFRDKLRVLMNGVVGFGGCTESRKFLAY